jgi:hypothetical protein
MRISLLPEDDVGTGIPHRRQMMVPVVVVVPSRIIMYNPPNPLISFDLLP